MAIFIVQRLNLFDASLGVMIGAVLPALRRWGNVNDSIVVKMAGVADAESRDVTEMQHRNFVPEWHVARSFWGVPLSS